MNAKSWLETLIFQEGKKRSVLSRLSPRSSMSSVERPVPMPSTSPTDFDFNLNYYISYNYKLNYNIYSNVNYNIYITKIVSDIAFPSLLKSINIIATSWSGTEEERSKRIESEATSLPTIHACLLYNFFANLGGCAIFLLDGTTHWGTQCHEIIEKSLVHYTWFECTSLR